MVSNSSCLAWSGDPDIGRQICPRPSVPPAHLRTFVSVGDPSNEDEKAKKDAGKPQVDEIVPVYRRDCHEEVYAGSHQYPGRGVYLLKFDNSYSLWRSKSVYYRVYYTR